MSKKVYITREIPELAIQILEQKGYEVTMSEKDTALSYDELKEAGKGMDAVLSLLTDKIDGELLDAWGDGVKVVSNYAVGYDNIDLDAAKERGVVVTNTPGVTSAESVAEHTFALLLAVAGRVVEADSFVREGKYVGWDPMLMLGSSVSDKKLGIVGLGRIGRQVAQIAVKGFGMEILYHDPKDDVEFDLDFDTHRVELDELLKECDFISLHVPLLPSTKGMIGAEQFKIMNSDAYIINTARGPVIDESALVEALRAGEIAGAGLDVFEDEPKLAPGLAELSNVVLTPHIASATMRTRNEMAEMAANNIIGVLEGEGQIFQVNK